MLGSRDPLTSTSKGMLIMQKNKKWLGLAVASIAAIVFAGSASAQSVSATGNATILQALTLTEDVELDFGRILAAVGSGTVTVTQAGAQSCVTVTCFNDAIAAEFTVTGTAGETVDVTTDAAYTLTGPGVDMAATTDAPATATIGGGGNVTFNVGGQLTVGASQAAGDYSGNYNVTVAYQ